MPENPKSLKEKDFEPRERVKSLIADAASNFEKEKPKKTHYTGRPIGRANANKLRKIIEEMTRSSSIVPIMGPWFALFPSIIRPPS